MQRTGSSETNRIAKLLARAGVASRREIERMIADGRVALNGTVIDTPATVLASLQGVTVDGVPVEAAAAARLFLFHKPTGYLTAATDPAGRKTIYDRLPDDLPRLMPVGRLDLNTEGLLLLTNDGELKRQLELPATGVERSYRARTYGPVSQAQLEDLIDGVEIEGIRYGKIDANLERRTGANAWVEMTLTEGKNREVRRVLEHLGLRVSRLIRTRYGPFILGDLPVGEVGEVKQHDLVAFRKTLKLPAEKRPEMDAPEIVRTARAALAKQASKPSLPAGASGEQLPALFRAAKGDARPDARPGVGRSQGSAASALRRPTPSAAAALPPGQSKQRLHSSLGQGGEKRGGRSSRSPTAARTGFATAPPAPTGGRSNRTPAPRKLEIREEIDTRPPRPPRAAPAVRPPRTATDTRPPRPLAATASGGPRDESARPPRTKRPSGWAKAKPKARPGKPKKPSR